MYPVLRGSASSGAIVSEQIDLKLDFNCLGDEAIQDLELVIPLAEKADPILIVFRKRCSQGIGANLANTE